MKRHHGEPDQERDATIHERSCAHALQLGARVEVDDVLSCAPHQDENGSDGEVHEPHCTKYTVKPKERNEDEAGSDRAKERPERIERVHIRVEARGVFETPRQCLSEKGNRPAHQHGGRNNQER